MNAPTTGTRRVHAGDSHYYLLDGERVDSVSDVLKRGLPKPALPSWAARQVAEFAADRLSVLKQLKRDEVVDLLRGAPYRDRERAAVRGTEVHRSAERLLRGEPLDLSGEQARMAEQYARFLREWRVEAVELERPAFSRGHRYAGTFDLLARVRSLGLVLLDLKTNRSGPFPEVAIQLAAYGYAEFYLDDVGREVEMPRPDTYAVLALRQDGYQLRPVDVGEWEWQTFLAAARVGGWLDGRGRRVLGEALVPPPAQEEVRDA
jgi:hypothetical protein